MFLDNICNVNLHVVTYICIGFVDYLEISNAVIVYNVKRNLQAM
jgi:hypothetical protein